MLVQNSRAAANARRIAVAVSVVPVPGADGARGPVRWKHPETGEHHSLDGPAIHRPGEYEAWYVDGIRHRTDGPAVQTADQELWYSNGVQHRLDGPASVDFAGKKTYEWWVNGAMVDDESDGAELDRMFDSGQIELLEMVLRLWTPGGPSIVELEQAVVAANA